METRSDSEEADDRISNLSDDVLIHILSFIPTMDSVATFILSKRWQNLWKHVPELTFDDNLPPFKPKRKTHTERFANSVTRLLDLHVPEALEKLSLTCNNHDIYNVGDWVTKSIMRNIQSLYLSVYNYTSAPADPLPDRLPVRLPSSLFTCATLEALVIKGSYHNIIVNVPTIVCLPNLKTMELVGLMFQDGQRDCFRKLISSCSSLESLLFVEGETQVNCSTLRDVEFRLCHRGLIGHEPEIFCSALRRLNLCLGCFCSKTIRVPNNVFTCETLEHLSLTGRFVICASRIICLPNLTFLALHDVEFEDDEIFSRLISNCISLESLSVYKTIEAEMNISSCTLKVIEVDLLCRSYPGHKLVINAPALNSLKLIITGHVDYHIEDSASLEQADISIKSGVFFCPEYGSFLNNAFQALRHLKSLKLYHGFWTSFRLLEFEFVLPMFNRLTDLDITIRSWLGYGLFQELIKNSPKLQNLAFELDAQPRILQAGVEIVDDLYWWNLNREPVYGGTICRLYWRYLNKVPACLLSSLRSVSIRSFRGHKIDLTMTTYMLENARVMEKMEVCLDQSYYPTKAMKKEFREKMLNVPRGSEKCKVVIK